MSKAKDEYYEFRNTAKRHFGGLESAIENYVNELEEKLCNQEKLIEELRKKDIPENGSN